MIGEKGGLKPKPMVEWLCPHVLIDQVCDLTSQDQRDNPRLNELVKQAIRKHRNSDNLRAILEYEQDRMTEQVAEHLTPQRLRELTVELRTSEMRTVDPSTMEHRTVEPREPNAETIIWKTLETALRNQQTDPQQADSQRNKSQSADCLGEQKKPGWAGINAVRLIAPDLFMAVQEELRDYQGPDRLHWEIDAEIERITLKVTDQLGSRKKDEPLSEPLSEPWKTPELWPPSMLWSRSWEKE